jgi:hypothetical protein
MKITDSVLLAAMLNVGIASASDTVVVSADPMNGPSGAVFSSSRSR